MSDVTLLLFGCVVTFIALAGVYVYVRESFAPGTEQPRPSRTRNGAPVESEIQEIA